MSATYNQILELAKTFLRERSTRLKPRDWQVILEQARQHFSKDLPLELIADISGSGTYEYALTSTVSGWVNGFSQIQEIEYPAGEQDPVILQRKKWRIYKPDSDTEKLRFLSSSPGTGETARIRYTTKHTLTEAASTIEDEDLRLVGMLAAHYAAQAMVADLLESNRSNLQADNTDFSQKATDLQSLADKLLKSYSSLLSGKTEGAATFFTGTKDFDMRAGYDGPYIVHDEDAR